ncbi:MAG: response regulator transcription factor [Actinobacteria bacterium]|nr:response regulator transcription factor [Actinomycetota bacterium]
MVRWPDEEDRLLQLRETGAPRLLFVEAGREPPLSDDCLEDWVRVPVDERELRARVNALTARAEHHGLHPEIDDDGLLRFRGRWVDLPPIERTVATALVERFGAVVGRDTLTRRAWPEQRPTRNALDVHMSRLRRRIVPLGLGVRTVRARGYLLQAVADRGADQGDGARWPT